MDISEYVDSIYYADLFRIQDKIWMITGKGKSLAGIIACNNDVGKNQFADDAVALILNNKLLYGRHDRGVLPKDSIEREQNHSFHKIDYIAHCLSETETEILYKHNHPSIVEVDAASLNSRLSDRMYPALPLRHFFNEEQYNWLENRKRRSDRFLELTNGIINTKFLLIPWMKTLEEKASLYSSFESF